MKPRDVALLRLAAQGLAAPRGSAAEVVRRLTAAQGQEYPGAVASIALRTGAGTRDEVVAALDAGDVVRSWPMRGTLHLVAAEDLPWMLDLSTARVVAGVRRRRDQLGIDDAMIERARELAVGALEVGRRSTRAELLARWEAGGLLDVKQRGYHLLWTIAQTGTVCFGPVADGEQQIVLLEEWIAAPRRLEREEALGELALRYFRGHGPATAADLARWAGLTLGDVRAGLALAAGGLERVDVDGTAHFMDPAAPAALEACRARARGVFLLPGFDELVLGYGDRSAVVPAEFAQRIVPGNNGIFRPTVVAGGQVVGTWRHTGRGPKRKLELEPFTTVSERVAKAARVRYRAFP